MKIERVTDANGTPLPAAIDAANVGETWLGPAALESLPPGIELPVIADRAYDSDPLREPLAEKGFDLIAPHRCNRTAESTNDGRKLRRYKRRWKIERTFAWLHSYRRAITRHDANTTCSKVSSNWPAPSSVSILKFQLCTVSIARRVLRKGGGSQNAMKVMMIFVYTY